MKRKILIVDDQPQFARLLCRAMREYNVCVESDPVAALVFARTFNPDLFVLDLMMPRMDGKELVSHLRSDPKLRNTPVVFLSALVQSGEDAEEAVLIDGYPAFGKPFNIEALKRFIDEQLSRHPTLVLAAGRLKNGTIAGQ